MIKKTNIIEIPRLKQSKAQGEIGYHFLEIIDKDISRKVSEVISEFKPVVINDRKERAKTPSSIKAFEKQMHTKEGEDKLFRSEYCRLLDYVLAFDLASRQGPPQGEEITLTFFGSLLLDNCRRNKIKNIFDVSNNELLARIYLFIDNYKKWNFIQIVRKKGPISIEDFISCLVELKIGVDLEKIKSGIVKKPEFQDKIRKEWKKSHSSPIIEYKWKQNMINILAKQSIAKMQKEHIGSLLDLYAEVGLLNRKDELTIYNESFISELRSKGFWRTSEEVDPTEFFSKAYEIYLKLSNNRKKISITLPPLRKKVCLALRIPWPTFDKILTKYPRGHKPFEVTLTRSSGFKRWGLFIQSKPFYFISLKKGGG